MRNSLDFSATGLQPESTVGIAASLVIKSRPMVSITRKSSREYSVVLESVGVLMFVSVNFTGMRYLDVYPVI